MSAIIEKIKMINYKRFLSYTIYPNQKVNIIVGDNETGKSSVIEAIDLVSSGNVRKVETIGLDKLLNIEAVHQFNNGARTFDNLPKLKIELYLKGSFDHTMSGKNNTDGRVCDGIRLICESNPDFQNEITDSLNDSKDYFPYDYYKIRFSTFADEGYTGYKKKLRSVLIDSTTMNSSHATNHFIKSMYNQYTETEVKERAAHKSYYRQMKNTFQKECLESLNSRVPANTNYKFGLKNGSSIDFENDLMIYEDEISIDNKGTGKKTIIKTDFALERSGENIDVILIEEPENHLSHSNLRILIQRVAAKQNGQLFITTHNSLISTRLELSNIIILHSNDGNTPTMLNDLSAETSKYFMKAPPANILEFAISDRVILVEGPSEYMLFEKFYETVTNHKPETDGVNIIDVRGLSFKRYLELSKLIGEKTAVVTDNDHDYKRHCVDKYSDYAQTNNIKIFFSQDNKQNTFEVVLYNNNRNLCNELFGNAALEYMLKNKTESAYQLLLSEKEIIVPEYIRRAIEWIKE